MDNKGLPRREKLFTRHILLYLILLFLIVKLLMLLFGEYFRYRGFYYELLPGMIAEGIIENKIFDLAYWSRGYFYGGPIVSGYLTVPLFILLGKTLFSLRLISLILSLLGFIFTLKIVKKYFGESTCIIAGMLYIFPPILFFMLSSMAYGNHSEIIVFNMAVLYVFYEIFYKGKKNIGYFGILGILSGFGTYFLLSHCIIVFCVLIFWYAYDKRMLLKKEFYIFLLFFLIGISPWIIICHPETVLRFGRPLEMVWLTQAKENLPKLIYRFLKNIGFLYKSLFLTDVSDKIDIREMFPGINSGAYKAYFAIFVVSYISCLWMERRAFLLLLKSIFSFKKNADVDEINPSVPVLLLPILFVFIYSLTTGKGTNDFAARYFMPVYPFIFTIIAMFLNFMWQKNLKVITVTSLMFSTGIFLVNTIPGLHTDHLFDLMKIRGYGHQLYYLSFRIRYTKENKEMFLKELKEVNDSYKPDIYFGLGYHSSKGFLMPTEQMEKDYLPFYYLSLGSNDTGRLAFMKIPGNEDLLSSLSGEYGIFYFMGVGISTDADILRDRLKGRQDSGFIKGIHNSAGFSLFLQGRPISNVDMFDSEHRKEIYEGMGWCYGAIGGIPEDYRYMQCLMPTIEWIDRFYKIRYSAGWADINIFTEGIPETCKRYFYEGAQEGEKAIHKILSIYDEGRALRILKKDGIVE